MMGYYYNTMGFGPGVGGLTMILLWILLVLAIVALWKYINSGKK